MSNSSHTKSTKCFSGIFRRLLCSGSLPTHPSDQLIESKIDDHKHEKSTINLKQASAPEPAPAPATTPGVVARLMGLDSFPSTPNYRNLGSFFRSKSVNSIDFLSLFDPINNANHHHHSHRRIRTSVSFREDDYINSFLRLEEDLLIKKEIRGKNREIFQEKQAGKVSNRPWKKVEIEENRKTGPGNITSQKRDFYGKANLSLKEKRPVIRAVNSKEELRRSKCVRSKRDKILGHKVHCLKKIHPEGSVPEVDGEVCSRKQLQYSQTANSVSPYSNSDNGKIITGKMMIKERCYYKRINAEEIYMQLAAEDDVRKNWINHGMVVLLKFDDDFEEICQQFGQQILEVLLKQFIDELCVL